MNKCRGAPDSWNWCLELVFGTKTRRAFTPVEVRRNALVVAFPRHLSIELRVRHGKLCSVISKRVLREWQPRRYNPGSRIVQFFLILEMPK